MAKTTKDELWASIRPDDLPGELPDIARACGMDVVRYLVESWGGLQIYCPVEINILRPHIREAIRRAWNGRNEEALARRYGVPRSEVVRALRADPPAPDPAQTKLSLE